MNPQGNPARGSRLEFEKRSFVRSLTNDSRAYRNLALELIFLCRFFVQAHDQSLDSSIRLRKVFLAADDALKSAATANRTSNEVDKKFGEAIDLLNSFEKNFPPKGPTSNSKVGGMVTRDAKMSDESESPLTILYALKENLHSKPMGNEWPRPTLQGSLSDVYPLVVKQVLSDSPSLQEILWNFSRFKDEKYRLTLRENPHFYAELPTSPEAYVDSVEIYPTEDFRCFDNFYILTDKPQHVYSIMTDQVSQAFGNIWCPQNALVFKGICGRIMGEGIVKASLKGTNCGFCERLPVSTTGIPKTSTNRRGLQPIIAEGYPKLGWKCSTSIGCLHSSVDIDLRVCTGEIASDSPLLPPFPPTSEQPGYTVAYRTHVHILNSDSLLQIFHHYRLEDEESWTLRLTWRRLAHVCRRWRHLLYDSWFHLDMCLLLKNNSPSIGTLSHLPLVPLFIDYSDRTGIMARKDEDNILFGLQQHGRVRRVDLQAPSSSLCMWLELMNKQFSGLRDLTLSSTTIEETNLMLPETLQAPGLHRLTLHGIGLPTGMPLLSSAISLSTLTLTRIGASCYFPPGHLVTQLQGLPHLEELSIGFAIPIPLPSSEGELLPTPIAPVTLPALIQLTFHGLDVYLDNLAAQINTPLLERLSVTLFFGLVFTLENLTEFIHRTKAFGCLFSQVAFNKDGASINVRHYENQDIGKVSLRVNCEPLDWQIDSATLVCSALEKVLSTVEDLRLDLDADEMPSRWEDALDNMLGYELLLPFMGVKKLHIAPPLTLELSRALHSVPGELVLELLPELQELEVQLIDPSKKAFSGFVETRKSVGRPVTLLSPSSQAPSPTRTRTLSKPKSPPTQKPRLVETPFGPKRIGRRDSQRPMPAENLQFRVPFPSFRIPKSTAKQILTDHPQIRILVLGKRGSGKSSLIKAAFKVDMSPAQARAPDINFPFRPDDNHRLIVHESPGLEPGDTQGLRAIRDFISTRIDPIRPAPERLHAIWICIPTSDAQNGNIGEGVEGILSIRRGSVPVVVAFTKSDASFPQITGSESGSSQYQDRTRTRAYAQCGQLCHSLFRRKPRDVPAELVSVAQQYGGLINNLIMTTDRLIMGSRTISTSESAWSSSQRTRPRIAPAPLVWSVALRASRDISIQASIEIGRSRYWRNLWSSLDFVDQPLESCVNVIHVDIVEIWNLCDKSKYLSSNQFKINMSHVVEELTVPAGGASSSFDWNGSADKFADWVYDVYRGSSRENVRCVMAYIVNLTVILDVIFKTAGGNVTDSVVMKVTNSHIRSGRRDCIYRDIRSFITETFAMRFAVPQKDLVLEKIVDLIREYCPTSPC